MTHILYLPKNMVVITFIITSKLFKNIIRVQLLSLIKLSIAKQLIANMLTLIDV